MLTLVAAVLAYDLAYDSALDTWGALDGCEFLSSGLRSRNVRSETKEEKDISKLVSMVLDISKFWECGQLRMEAIESENE